MNVVNKIFNGVDLGFLIKYWIVGAVLFYFAVINPSTATLGNSYFFIFVAIINTIVFPFTYLVLFYILNTIWQDHTFFVAGSIITWIIYILYWIISRMFLWFFSFLIAPVGMLISYFRN